VQEKAENRSDKNVSFFSFQEESNKMIITIAQGFSAAKRATEVQNV